MTQCTSNEVVRYKQSDEPQQLSRAPLPSRQRCLRLNPKLKGKKGNPNVNTTSQLQFVFLSLLLSHKHMHIHLKQSCVPEVKTFLRRESLKIQHPVTFVLIAVLLLVSISVINEVFLDWQGAFTQILITFSTYNLGFRIKIAVRRNMQVNADFFKAHCFWTY